MHEDDPGAQARGSPSLPGQAREGPRDEAAVGGPCRRGGPLLEAVGGQEGRARKAPEEATAGAKPQAASPREDGAGGWAEWWAAGQAAGRPLGRFPSGALRSM